MFILSKPTYRKTFKCGILTYIFLRLPDKCPLFASVVSRVHKKRLFSAALALHDSVIDVDSFTGFQVYRAVPKDQSNASYLQTLRTIREHYDFWTEVRINGPVDIMVPPGKQEQLENDFELKGISYEIMIPDVQKLIELEKIAAPSTEAANPKHAN